MGGYTQMSKSRCAERQKQPLIYTNLQGSGLNLEDKTNHRGHGDHGENSVKNAAVDCVENADKAVQCRTSLILPFSNRREAMGRPHDRLGTFCAVWTYLAVGRAQGCRVAPHS